jgi:hypothetical protein
MPAAALARHSGPDTDGEDDMRPVTTVVCKVLYTYEGADNDLALPVRKGEHVLVVVPGDLSADWVEATLCNHQGEVTTDRHGDQRTGAVPSNYVDLKRVKVAIQQNAAEEKKRKKKTGKMHKVSSKEKDLSELKNSGILEKRRQKFSQFARDKAPTPPSATDASPRGRKFPSLQRQKSRARDSKWFRAAHSFKSSNTDTISFTKGDTFAVVAHGESEHWFKGVCMQTAARSVCMVGNKGLVPANYFDTSEEVKAYDGAG